ncbi:MAG: outer membrane protein transport protein [Myxococcales bacterium]|nr:outer membrane protein transport protein [Myxococcales bacterium]
MKRSAVRPLAGIAAALAFIACFAAMPQRAHAGGFTITLMGGRRSATMVNLATPDDTTAIFHNAAGLADQPGVRLHVGASLTFLSTRFEMQALDPTRFPEINAPNCGRPGQLRCWPIGSNGYYSNIIEPERTFGALPFLGASTDLRFLGRKDITVGLAVYAPNFYGAFLPSDAPTAYHLIDGTFFVVATTAAVGWRINRYIAIGARLSYHYMRLGFSRKLSLIDSLTPPGQAPDGLATTGQALLGDLLLDYSGVDHGIGWGASLLFNPFRWLAFGFNYGGASAARFDGDVTFRGLGRQIRDQPPERLREVVSTIGYKLPRSLIVELPIPHTLQWGVAVKPTRWLEIGVDYRLWLYNFFEKQIISPRYDADEPGQEPLTEAQLSRDKNYSVSYELGIGFLVRPLPTRRPDLELMAGVSYDKSPIPDETFTLDNPSLDLIQIGSGVRMTLFRHWRVALTYMVLVYLQRDVTTSQTSPPTNARGRGVAHLPGVEVEYLF